MNWVKENKFLTGYIIVMVIGLGILGFEVFSASGAYDEVLDAYQKQAATYDQLRKEAPFPSRANLDKYDDQKKDAANVITAFQVDLSKKEFPLKPLTPEGFQDLLKETVTDVRKKAGDANVKLPDKFFLGFDKYETTPPTPDAAAPLGRELKAIEWVVNQYIDNGVLEIESLVRADLPEEKAPSAGPRGESAGPRGGASGRPQRGGGGGNRAGGPGGGAAGGGGARQDLVHYYPFEILTICKQQRFQPLLNVITGSKAPQFYVIRQVRIRNQKEKGPSKATPAPDNNAKPAGPEFILGEEFIEASLQIDVVDFTAPSDSSTVADKSAPTEK